jgi:hypothetical protein
VGLEALNIRVESFLHKSIFVRKTKSGYSSDGKLRKIARDTSRHELAYLPKKALIIF